MRQPGDGVKRGIETAASVGVAVDGVAVDMVEMFACSTVDAGFDELWGQGR